MDAFNRNAMTAYQWIFLAGFIVCFLACAWHLIHTLILTFPKEYAKPRGKILPAIGYSFTKAMLPSRKETAYLHLPTYLGGLMYHIGTFLGFFLAFLFFFGYFPSETTSLFLTGILVLSFSAGLFILIKRALRKDLRGLSNADDYISNLFVTLFHGLAGAALLVHALVPFLLIFTGLLMLYIPVGKLRHVVYFFTSRIYLSVFYGRRGVWPAEKDEQ